MNPYLLRCLELAAIPGSNVEPNPRVGAIVVYKGRIIGEGKHEHFGGPHAEVNAIHSVKDKSLLPESTLYVSLEPCNHQGKTPACTKLILQHNIPRIVIGSTDANPRMAGKSIEILASSGVSVLLNENQQPFHELNKHFRTQQLKSRPFITLKWAESKDGFMARFDGQKKLQSARISHPDVSKWVHQLRHEHQAILVGKGTVEADWPQLNTRKWPGRDPLRIILDPLLETNYEKRAPDGGPILIVNKLNAETSGSVRNYIPQDRRAWKRMDLLMAELYLHCQVGSVLVEGGRLVHDQFILQSCWDEAWQNIGQADLGAGLPAPRISVPACRREDLSGDQLIHYRKPGSELG